MGLLADVGGSFLLGVATPLTAACVLPLYPGFLAYLANQFSDDTERRAYAAFGMLVVAGVLSFMLVLGLLFTTVLQASLTSVIQVASPSAFAVLAAISVLLLLDVDLSRVIPHVDQPSTGNVLVDAYGFGFFFGAIVVPCNPGFIAVFFARSFLFTDPAASIANFLGFGLGIGAPLLAFSLVSAQWSKQVITALTRHRSLINRGTGAIMLVVALYYLTAVFRIIPLP